MYPNQGIGKCYLCLLVRIECDKISLITLPSLRQEFSDITCEFFDLAFTLATFPTFRACTSWYKLVQAGTSSKKFFVGLLMTTASSSLPASSLSFVLSFTYVNNLCQLFHSTPGPENKSSTFGVKSCGGAPAISISNFTIMHVLSFSL